MKYQNEMIEKYEALQAEAKRIEKELDAMKKEFISSNGGESDDHLIVIKDNFRESVASKADFEKKFGASWLKDNGMLKLSAFNTVVISRKIEKKVG
jgi:hypothetical protein